MEKRSGLIHALAHCETCGWEATGYRNAQAIAAKHAKKHGHVVSGEIGIGFTYDGTK